MINRPRCARIALLSFLLLGLPSYGGPQDSSPSGAQTKKEKKGSVVYVCACLKTKSCSCMTIAKMEGPCACGPKGGPPLKAVPRDSDWAKENREAVAN